MALRTELKPELKPELKLETTDKASAARSLAEKINEIKNTIKMDEINSEFLERKYFTSNEDYKSNDIEKHFSDMKPIQNKLNVAVILGGGNIFSLDLSALDVVIFFDANEEVLLFNKTIIEILISSHSREEFVNNFYKIVAEKLKITKDEEVHELFSSMLQRGELLLKQFFLSSVEVYQRCRARVQKQVFAFCCGDFLNQEHIASLVKVIDENAAVVRIINVTNLPEYCRIDREKSNLLLRSLEVLSHPDSMLQLSGRPQGLSHLVSNIMLPRHFQLLLKYAEKCEFDFYVELKHLEYLDNLSLTQPKEFDALAKIASDPTSVESQMAMITFFAKVVEDLQNSESDSPRQNGRGSYPYFHSSTKAKVEKSDQKQDGAVIKPGFSS